jgi:hypothetical protein
MEKKKAQMYAKDSLIPGNNYDLPACGSSKKGQKRKGWLDCTRGFYTNTS